VIAVSKTLAELASEVGGKVIGDGELVIRSVASIEEAGPGQIAFLANPRYRPHLALSRAGAVIVGFGVIKDGTIDRLGKNYLEVADPYLAFAKILTIFAPPISYNRKVNASAHVDPTAILGEDVTLFANAFVGPRSQVGARSVLYPGVYIGDDVQIGAGCILHSNVVVRDGCRIGDRVIIHPGAVIGSDGFGFAGEGDHRAKIPQSGIVEIHDNVEIGANTTVDRATLGKTIIGRGTKIDNLVQIAHNVVIGENSIIAAQVGIAGSTRIGNNVTLAGQAGVVNHIRIGDGAVIGPQSGIPQSVPAGAVLSGGIAAAPHHEWLKVITLLPQLPKIWKVVRSLEKRVADLTKRADDKDRSHA
jgi:UDP-3-O-[3-hydroxymyristoyl] glucosamine N-acyltransferase